jgi:uroporphyrin-III C-methyltransferase
MTDLPPNMDRSAEQGEVKASNPPLFSLGTLIALAAAAIAIVLTIGVWFEARSENDKLTQSFGAKLAEMERVSKAQLTNTEAAQRELRDAQSRLAQLEVKLNEVQNQRVAIEEMTRDLARAPEDWLLAEIEQTLNIASRELTLAGNVRAAIAALQTVDQRLARAEKLQSTPLRRAVTQDLERLKATPGVDTQGITVKLDNLMTLTSTLPLSLADGAPLAGGVTANTAASPEAATQTASSNWFSRAWQDLKRDLKDLIRIRELEGGEVALLTPQQAWFARESLRLRLLSARTSLLARDEISFKDDIKVARELLSKYFDPKAKVNQNTLVMLKQLQENPVSIAAPDIVQSLNAIRAARTARERPAR